MSVGQPYGECARCGFKRRLSKLATEYTGLRVCRDTCLDPKPAEHRPPRFKPEGVIVPGAAPETVPIFRDENDPGGSDL